MQNIEILKTLVTYKEELFALYSTSDYSTFKNDIKKVKSFIYNMHSMVLNDKIHPANNDVIDYFFKASGSLLESFYKRNTLANNYSKEANEQKMNSMKQSLEDLVSFESFLNTTQ